MKETKLSKALTRLDVTDLATLEFRANFKHSNFTNSNGELREGTLNKLKGLDNLNYKQAKKSINNITSNQTLERLQINAGIKRTIINNIKYEMVKTIKAEYGSYYAIWLPSTSVHKRKEHVANYGKTFKVSEGLGGEFPGEEYGCKCGLQILEEEGSLAADKVQQRGYQEKLSSLLLFPKISLRNMVLATILGTSFLTHKNNIKKQNKQKKLTRAGLQDYKEALITGGGTIKQRAREVIANINLQGKRFNKIIAKVKGGKLAIPVVVELKQDNKTKLIKTTAKISTNDKDILIKRTGIYIRNKRQSKLEEQVIKELALKHNTAKLEVISFGGVED